MRTFVRWLRAAPRRVRWPVVALIFCVLLWPQFALAAYGHPVALTLLSIGLLMPIFRRIEADAIRSRTGWDAGEARDRVALARRGVLPEKERERAGLRFLLDRELSQGRGAVWSVPVGVVALVAWVLVVGITQDLPLFAILACAWYVALGTAVLPSAVRSARREKAEIRHALQLLGDA